MNHRKISVILLSVALALGISGSVAIFAHRARLRVESEVADSRRKNRALQETLQLLNTAPNLPSERPVRSEAITLPGSSGVTNPISPSGSLRELNHRKQKDRVIVLHPELLALYSRARREDIHRNYAAFYRDLALSPQAIERFEQLRERDGEDEMDLAMIQHDANLRADDAVLRQARNTLAEEVRAGQRALLGPDGYEKLQAFERAQALRDVTDHVAAFLLFSDPLNGNQSARLTQLLADSSASYRNGRPADRFTVDWDNVIIRAPDFLSSTQVAAIHAEAQKWRAVRLLSEFFIRQGHVY